MAKKYVMGNSADFFAQNGSTEFKVITSTGLTYSNGSALNFQETGTTSANLTNYGLSLLTYSSAANTYTLSAPQTGIKKTIVLNSTLAPDSTAIPMSVYTGSTAIFIRDNSTAYTEKLYINMLTPFASAELIGISTSQWGVISSYGAVQFSTATGYTT